MRSSGQAEEDLCCNTSRFQCFQGHKRGVSSPAQFCFLEGKKKVNQIYCQSKIMNQRRDFPLDYRDNVNKLSCISRQVFTNKTYMSNTPELSRIVWDTQRSHSQEVRWRET